MLRALRIHRARTLLSEAIKEWLLDIQGLSTNTQDYYRRTLSGLAATVPDKPIDKLTTADLRKYLTSLLWGRKKSTVNNSLMALRSFGRFIAENYDLPNPAAPIKKFKAEPVVGRFLTYEQYEKLLAACKTDRQKDILILLANTGLRASELCALTWDSVSPELTRITIIGKGGKVRIVPLNQNCRNVLLKYPRVPGNTISFLPKSRKVLCNLVHRIGVRANIPANPHANPHALRHLFATELLRRGVKIAFVSKCLGHSSIAITEKCYIHLLPDYLMGVTDVLDG